MFNRGYGDLNRNVLLALSANVVATAAATTGLPFVKPVFVGTSLVLGALIFGFGLLSDLRSRFYPQGGVGIFFGTFNPFHATHVAIVERALNERGLSKILVHPTVVPKLHARAFERGEIRIARVEDGLAVLERTPKADLNVNYFPTGNRFFAPETRKLMIELALEEANLADRVEVLWMPDTYREKGFHGVVAEVRRAHPSVAIHGIHGSDLGGMWVRSIYDESGWIYPFAVKRRDAVSATAIRNGATGMTTRAVSAVLAQLRAGTDVVEVGQRRFHNVGGILSAIEA
jgi:nicotinamide mononucleotide adenylyltransferase